MLPPTLESRAMQFLFNSRGKHIANMVNNQLHAPNGKNIGHLLSDQGFFIDMRGRYLGEIVNNDRLMRRTSAPSGSWGSYGNYGNSGSYGNPGNAGSIGSIGGYKDVPEDLLS
jgi:hypothetical protein